VISGSPVSCADLLSRLERVRPSKSGWQARCPAHDDREPSLSISEGADGRALVHCFAGCAPEAVAAALGLTLAELGPSRAPQLSPPRKDRRAPSITAIQVREVWTAALERARDDRHVEADRETYAFLNGRGIAEAWECCAYGVLAPGMRLPPAIAGWPGSGHRLVVPLFDHNGHLANVQARNVLGREPKTLFPAGSTVRSCVFADDRARALMRCTSVAPRAVLVGEGLTDYLALGMASSVPVVAIPGTGFAAEALGPWVRGHTLVLAFDADEAGRVAASIAAERAHKLGAARVHIVTWGGGAKDACDALQRFGADAFRVQLEALCAEAAP